MPENNGPVTNPMYIPIANRPCIWDGSAPACDAAIKIISGTK